MQLRESGEMYLETILILSRKKSLVRAIDIGEYMGFSKPSVSRAMHLLRDENYIRIGDDGGISLTAEGMEIAYKIYERHELLSRALMMLGVDEKTAVRDACRMEHVISDETFRAIKSYIQGQF
ncbi:MAG: metal-dependent transcriptional regulator [Lachnospiraceae bacterium]|nr:metal-dependent transcriptional regulator [Lachnospiraceae bacterium]